MSSLLNSKESIFSQDFLGNIPEGWQDFFGRDEIVKILSRNIKILRRRSQGLGEKKIWPKLLNILDAFRVMRPEEVRVVVVLPHAYPFDSCTGVPVMIKDKWIKQTVSVTNILRIFPSASRDNFNSIWKKGVLLVNMALTEEEYNKMKISHEILWSLFVEELFLYFNDAKFRNEITFAFTGTAGIRYKSLIDTSTGRKSIVDLPAITENKFPEKFKEVLSGSTEI